MVLVAWGNTPPPFSFSVHIVKLRRCQVDVGEIMYVSRVLYLSASVQQQEFILIYLL